MPVPTDITAGTLTITNASTAVVGVGTSWSASDLRQGDLILWIEGGDGFWQPIIQSVESNTALTLAEPWEGPTLSGVRYRIRYQWDSSRVSAQSRQLIEMLDNGNVLSFSGLTGPGVPVFDGPHSLVIKPETDFINGVAYDVQVDTLADRAAYDGQAEGFSVLVSDVGDGRSALYSKVSNSVGDWSDPAYITGPVGPLPSLEAGTTTTLPPGSNATFDVVPVSGGYQLNTGIPAGEGFVNAGVYNIANAYNQSDVVRHNGSSFIALQAVPAGQSPSSVYPPVDTAYWQVLVVAGQNGTGTGDVVGPASATDRRLAVFSGTTGKLIDQSVALSAAQQGQARADLGVEVVSGTRNKIINGDFVVSQRGSSGTIATGASAWVGDRWRLTNNSNQPLAWSIVTAQDDGGRPGNLLAIVFSVAPTTGTIDLVQNIEGVRTLAGRGVTFSVEVRGNTPIAGQAHNFALYQRFGSGGSPETTTATVLPATVGYHKSFMVLPSTSGKTVGVGSTLSASLIFTPRTTGTLFLKRISVVEGDATQETDPFSERHIEEEVALCSRYYQNWDNSFALASGDAANINKYVLPVTMRAVPTITQTTATGTGGSWVCSVSRLSQSGYHSVYADTTTLRLDAEL